MESLLKRDNEYLNLEVLLYKKDFRLFLGNIYKFFTVN